MPKVADSTEGYVVASVEVAVGDVVSATDVVLVVETDKVDADVEASVAGTVVAVRVAEGDEVRVGDVVLEYEATA